MGRWEAKLGLPTLAASTWGDVTPPQTRCGASRQPPAQGWVPPRAPSVGVGVASSPTARRGTSLSLALALAALASSPLAAEDGANPAPTPQKDAAASQGSGAEATDAEAGPPDVAVELQASPTREPHRDAAPAREEDSPQAFEETSGWDADASFFEEYRLRRTSNALGHPGPLDEPLAAEDQIDQRLRLLSDAQVEGASGRFRAVFSGALWWDLGGSPEAGSPNLLASQYDEHQPWVAPYALSVEWRHYGMLDHLRVGRQDAEHGMPLTFDGGSVAFEPLGRPVQLFAFGGQTVHFFETSPGLLEDWVGSAGAVVRPSRALSFEFDARIVRDTLEDRETAEREPVTTHSYGVNAAARTEAIVARLYARAIDEVPSHAGGRMQLAITDWGFGVDSRIDLQLVTLGEIVESENPFFSLLGTSLPNARFVFESWKELSLGEEALSTLHAGWRGRQLLGGDERPFNRNSGAVYVHARFEDLVQQGLFAAMSAEWNYVPGAMDSEWLLTLGGSAGYSGVALKTEVGTYYQQYKINYYQRAEELRDARTVYGSLGYRVAEWLELRARYEFEIVDRYLESYFLSARQDF